MSSPTSPSRRSHAIAAMLLATMLWSTAGVISRQFEVASGIVLTFGRSALTALILLIFLCITQGGLRPLMRQLGRSGWALWLSALCWGTMFTAYMLAFSLTKVANVLLPIALEPFFSAVLAGILLGTQIPQRTRVAIAVAGIGIASIFVSDVDTTQWQGTLLSMLIPLAASFNWLLLQKANARSWPQPVNLLLAVALGAALSALVCAPWAIPAILQKPLPWADWALLLFLGAFQLALPCALALHASKRLLAHELSMLALLEILFGSALAWAIAGESLPPNVLWGGALVFAALIGNEWLNARAGLNTGAEKP